MLSSWVADLSFSDIDFSVYTVGSCSKDLPGFREDELRPHVTLSGHTVSQRHGSNDWLV
jgi:hypothetical protein